ncbi:hypothetical protein C8E03_108134 [Lachnotalea glycerini]|uniref:Uncharacterized protein n=2 Tax=Lachnotalea glycerini TaxID=1763509 RepID=A0A318EK36_9FIRM|nr:hypothetical protein CG709_16345 [Lachnotalea glycerini]PXV88407.1 hypothetical protein C8E03_108134 [Lachnotalea glycerini]
MDIKNFAKMIDGKEYGYPMFSKKELQIAKDNGFVIVSGASDDLMEFEGTIQDEQGCYDGGMIYFDRQGAFGSDGYATNRIEALWCDDKESKDDSGNIITWTYKTDIPHETFMVYEDGEPYCRGIVFSIADLKE